MLNYFINIIIQEMYRVMLRVLHSTGGDVVLKSTNRIVQSTKHIVAAAQLIWIATEVISTYTLSQDTLTQSYFNSIFQLCIPCGIFYAEFRQFDYVFLGQKNYLLLQQDSIIKLNISF